MQPASSDASAGPTQMTQLKRWGPLGLLVVVIIVIVALALLLAGPALSLPNMLVIRTVLGTQKTLVFVALVVVLVIILSAMIAMW